MLGCFYLQSIVFLLTFMMQLFVPAASIFSFGRLCVNVFPMIWSSSKGNCPQAMLYQGYGGYIQDPWVVKSLSVLCCVKCSARLLYLIHGAFGFHLPYLWMIRKINVFIFHSYMSFVLLTQHACIPFHFSFIMSVFPFVICHVASFFQTWALLFESSGRMNYSFVPAVSLPRSACDCGVQHLSWNISLCSE